MSKRKIDVSGRLEDQIKKMAKKVNDSLYRLEQSGYADDSKIYQNMQHYAIDLNSKYYNVNLDEGRIRVTTDLGRFETLTDLYRYRDTLKSILNAKTRTVSGTKAAISKGKKTFEESIAKRNQPKMSYEEYRDIFKLWRTKVSENKKIKFGSDKVMELIENTNLYALTPEQVEETLKYVAERGTEKMLSKYAKLKHGMWEIKDKKKDKRYHKSRRWKKK